MNKKITSIDEYISQFSVDVQERLKQILQVVKEIAPHSDEVINYGIPTLQIKGKNFVHFAGYETHVGFYPTPPVLEEFKDKIQNYKNAKGSVQFQNNQPLPLDLIKEMTEFRLTQI